MGFEDSFTDGDGLLRILFGIVRISNSNPVRVFVFDVFFTGDIPGVLVSNSSLGIVPDILDSAVNIHAAFLQGFNTHVDQHWAKGGRHTLGDHQGAGVGGDIGVPGGDDDAHVAGFLEFLIQSGSVNRGDGDGINAGVDRLLDDFELIGHGSDSGAHVADFNAPFLGVLLCAVVGSFKEGVTGELRDESNNFTLDAVLSEN